MRKPKSEYLAEIGQRLKIRRKELGLKQQDAAGKLGISGAYLSEIESGNGNPDIDLLRSISTFYDMDFFYLLTGEEREEERPKQRPVVVDIDLDDGLDSIDKLYWLIDQSSYIKTSVLSVVSRFLIENKDLIRSILDKKSEKS